MGGEQGGPTTMSGLISEKGPRAAVSAKGACPFIAPSARASRPLMKDYGIKGGCERPCENNMSLGRRRIERLPEARRICWSAGDAQNFATMERDSIPSAIGPGETDTRPLAIPRTIAMPNYSPNNARSAHIGPLSHLMVAPSLSGGGFLGLPLPLFGLKLAFLMK